VSPLSENEQERYFRQIIIGGIGTEGQEQIRKAKVFLAGLGGLGSISAYYLAAAGIGQLTIVDKDLVTLDNLNRQLIHWTEDIGRPKVDSVKKLQRLNPLCRIAPIQAEMTDQNILDLVGDCSMIVDATDTLVTRKILNRASLRKRIPYIFGGIDGFKGMITTFIPGVTGCLECIFPGSPRPADAVGVLGPIPGWVASLQSLEAIKIALGMKDDLLTGRLLVFKGKEMVLNEIRFGKNPDCAECRS
jgi:molybdopterin-synthase adenylyltransferase